MFHKKIAACILLCGVSHTCVSMQLAYSAADMVKNGFQTANEKMYPTEIFKKIHQKWETADDRKKVTLLQKLNRGFLDGFLVEEDLTKLLDAIEDTIPKFPISAQTLNILHTHMVMKLPTLDSRPNIKLRALKAMYLIKPEQLAIDIVKSRFSNYVTDSTHRETIVSHITQSIIKSGNALQANELVRALAEKKEIPFGTTAQADLKDFLAKTAHESFRSCEYIDELKNTKEDEQLKQLAMAALERAKSQRDKLDAAKKDQEREEKICAEQLQKAFAVIATARQAHADKLKAIQDQNEDLQQTIVKERSLCDALKANLENVIAERQATQKLIQENSDNSNNN